MHKPDTVQFPARGQFLLIRTENHPIALPLSVVLETMRPQPVQSVANAPDFVSGLSIVRGEAVPVINLDAMLGSDNVQPRRLILARTPQRRIAFLTGGRVELVEIESALWHAVPALADQFLPEAVRAAAAVEESLAFLLDVAKVLPDGWQPEAERRSGEHN